MGLRIVEVDPGERPRPRISLCMIMRDEEEHLARCLTSVRDVVDEIVIVDTGSVDRSVQIAAGFGATVLHQEWRGDFAAPRNTGIDAATGAEQFLCSIERGHVFVLAADGNSIFEMGQKGLTRHDLRTCAAQELPIRNFNNNGPGGLKLSRDGNSLLVKTMRYIGVYDIAAGTLRDIYYRKEEVGSIVWAADWSADGQQILATVRPGMGNQRRELWTFPAAGGAPAVQSLAAPFRGFTVSADGRNVAAMRDYNHRQVWSLENFLPSAR